MGEGMSDELVLFTLIYDITKFICIIASAVFLLQVQCEVFLTLNYNLVLIVQFYVQFYQLFSFYQLIIFQEEEIKLKPIIAQSSFNDFWLHLDVIEM